MQDAEACFMIAARNYTDKTAAVSIIQPTRLNSIIFLLQYPTNKLSLKSFDFLLFRSSSELWITIQ